MSDYTLAGKLTRTDDGSFTLTLTGTPSGDPPTEPPPNPDIPADAIILEPSGGDDTEMLRTAANDLPDGGTLLLKGMFRVSDTIKFSGRSRRTVAGYPEVRSGILVESADMPGHYGSMLWFDAATGSTMRDLEIDAQNKSTQPMVITGGSDNTILRCYIHDIGYSGTDDPTLAAIHSEHSTRLRIAECRIERTGGSTEVDSGIRGIWAGKGQMELIVEDNEVHDTGHTSIAVEPGSGTIRRNRAYNSMTQGTLFKIMLHPETPAVGEVEFYENYGENSRNAGLMIEGGAYSRIDVHHNHFKGCGAEGTSFGALYTSQWTTTNLRYHDNVIEDCRSQGAMNRADNCIIENNQISGEDTLWLENDNSNITVNNSGNVSIGNNCSHIWVDGKWVA